MRFTYADPCEGFDRSRVKGVVCELIEVRDARYTTAVEVCAGGKLFQVVVDNEKTGELLLKKGNLQRRVTIIPLNKIRYHTVPPQKVLSAQKLCPSGDACLALTLVGYDKSVQEAIEYVFGSTIVCDTLEAARKVAFDPSVRTRSVTVDGDVCDPSGVLEGGSRSRGKSVLSLLSSVNSVRGEVKSLEKEASGLREELKVWRDRSHAYRECERRLELELHNLEVLDGSVESLSCERVKEELDKKRIVLVAGFQGVDKYGDVTTLGRGGSDTTAVAMAIALQADLCQIFTDVDGVYTCDPRIVPEAKKLPEITYNEMLELASLGAQVLNNRSVELAKSYGVQLEVLSSFSGNPGTIVKEVVKNVEKTYIAGVAQDKKIARIALAAMPDVPGVAYKVFSMLAKEKINVDMILQSYGHDECKDIVFTVADKDAARCEEVLNANRDSLKFDHIDINTDVAKVSVVGAGMQGNPGVAAKMFEALYAAHINIHMISTSEIKLSVLIDKEDSERAMRAVHAQFFQ